MRLWKRGRTSGPRTGLPTGRLAPIGSLATAALLLIAPVQADAQVRLTVPEALQLAFPEAEVIERETAFLSDQQLRAARRLAGPGVQVEHSVITYYRARRGGRITAVAYFDSHIVRTLEEVVMVVVTPQGEVERIEVLKFHEPPEYLAPQGWLDQFNGQDLSDDLWLQRAIVNMTGATLTSQAITRAVRRVLAVHATIRPFEEDEGEQGMK